MSKKEKKLSYFVTSTKSGHFRFKADGRKAFMVTPFTAIDPERTKAETINALESAGHRVNDLTVSKNQKATDTENPKGDA